MSIISLCVTKTSISDKTCESDEIYAIDPAFRPIPPGASLICVKHKGGHISDVITQYDPFNRDIECTNFIAWVEPVPYTTALYLYREGEYVTTSFVRDTTKEQLLISPIYILVDPEKKAVRVPGYNSEEKEFKLKGDEPQFLFRGYQGRCLPDPDGIPLEQCSKKFIENRNVSHEPTLLNYLSRKEIEEADSQRKVWGVKVDVVVWLIAITTLLVVIVGVLKARK